MDQLREFELIVARAKRAGLLKASYPEARLVVLEYPPPPEPPAEPEKPDD